MENKCKFHDNCKCDCEQCTYKPFQSTRGLFIEATNAMWEGFSEMNMPDKLAFIKILADSIH